LRERAARRGAHRRGADGGDARMEFGVEEGFQWWKAGEADAWAVGEACAALGRGRARQTARGGRKRSAGGSFLREATGRGARRGGHHVEAGQKSEEGPGRGVEQHGGVASARQQPGHSACGRRVAARQWRTAGSARRGST
jgi:hypothetical protein